MTPAHLEDVACAALRTHSFSRQSSTLETNKSSLHMTRKAAGSWNMCDSCPGKDKDLQVAVRGAWSHDLGDHGSALETNAALVLGPRHHVGRPRQQKAQRRPPATGILLQHFLAECS